MISNEYKLEPLDEEGIAFQLQLNSFLSTNQFESAIRAIISRRDDFQFSFTFTPLQQNTLAQPLGTLKTLSQDSGGRFALPPGRGISVGGVPVGNKPFGGMPGGNIPAIPGSVQASIYFAGTNQKPLGGMNQIIVGKQGNNLGLMPGTTIDKRALGGGIKPQFNQFRPN